jgi:hypothetical protein
MSPGDDVIGDVNNDDDDDDDDVSGVDAGRRYSIIVPVGVCAECVLLPLGRPVRCAAFH